MTRLRDAAGAGSERPEGVRARGAKRAEDTSAGCRANAAADLGRAEALGADPTRWRMERSAAAWTARAVQLERDEARFQARSRDLSGMRGH